ncbi:hypothetical protein BXT86_02405 [candidate division WOR-3 bacterium 4484_100]|uniref:Malonyl CoA-acyl carrier protein transacylase n=1 Tax=candidate division WOR-3 bacterium 4484_100 TaxID=1936077 RepID=A0A1V4QFT0_UNCW3|nr:MAG: hypothetical protein BXT86_02405 [candidate division WOR-3 bacterium 4484_100]
MKKVAFLFDGQGAFRPGVGKQLCSMHGQAKEIIEKGSRILGYDLVPHLWGDEAGDTVNRTSIAQPAISLVSLAYARVLKELGILGDISLGHSLGEVTALVYCETVSFEDGVRIIQKRGEVMEKAGGMGAMMAIINLDQEKLAKICDEVSKQISEPVVIANINGPNQIVISGSKQGLKKVAQIVAQHHARAIPLKVGGAWHSPYLNDASKEFAQFLDTITFKTPVHKFYSITEQQVLTEPDSIKSALKKQMLAQVNWVQAIENLKGLGYQVFVEVGPSKILKDLTARIDPQLKLASTALYTDPKELKSYLDTL